MRLSPMDDRYRYTSQVPNKGKKMNAQNKFNMTENGIERFKKVEGQTAQELTMRYNTGVCRYELECAFEVLKRTSAKMPESGLDELQELSIQSAAANAVITTFFQLGEAMSAWYPTSVTGSLGADKSAEQKMLVEMEKFDKVVTDLKQYL